MGVISYKTEMSTSIPAAKAFRAIVSAENLIQSTLLPVLKSAEVVEEITSGEGNRDRTVKHNKVEALDNENFSCCFWKKKKNFTYCYSITEGNAQGTTLERISYEVKITASPEGGSVCKNASKYFNKDDAGITEEKMMAVKDKAFALFQAIEFYLVANPHD